MPETKIEKTPVEQLQKPATQTEPLTPVNPHIAPAQRALSYAEKMRGLTADERIWQLAKSKAVALSNLPDGWLPR